MSASKKPRNIPREQPYLRQAIFHPERPPDFSRHPERLRQLLADDKP